MYERVHHKGALWLLLPRAPVKITSPPPTAEVNFPKFLTIIVTWGHGPISKSRSQSPEKNRATRWVPSATPTAPNTRVCCRCCWCQTLPVPPGARRKRERERVENNREREFNGFVRPARAWSNAKYSLSSRFVWQTTLDVDDLLSVTKLFPACWRLFDLLRTIVD